MASDHDDDLRALKRVIGLCRSQASALDMPALSYLLGKAEAALASHRGLPPQAAQRRAPPPLRDGIVRH